MRSSYLECSHLYADLSSVLYDRRMISEYNTETLQLHSENVANKQAALAKATQDRDEVIRAVLERGDGLPTEVGRITGLTRGRIYQIKNDGAIKLV